MILQRPAILAVVSAMLLIASAAGTADTQADPPFLLSDRGPDGNRLITQPLPLADMRHAIAAVDGVPQWAVGYQTDGAATWYVQTNSGALYRVTANDRGVQVAKFPDHRDANEPLFLVRSGQSVAPWVPAMDGTRPIDYIPREPAYDTEIEPLPDAQPALTTDGAWVILSSPTERYAHGILGDRLEGSTISVVRPAEKEPSTNGRAKTIVDLSPQVAEERGVLLYDVDADGQDEIITILSDTALGSRVVAFELNGSVSAEGDPIGQGFRWRHLIGAGPLGPAGQPAVAVVRTPHIGGTLEYLSYTPMTGTTGLERVDSVPIASLIVAEGRYGYSSHSIGSQNLGDAVLANVNGGERVEVILPTQSRDVIVAVGRIVGGSEEVWRFELGARLTSNLSVAQEWVGQRSGGVRRAAMLVGAADGSMHVWW